MDGDIKLIQHGLLVTHFISEVSQMLDKIALSRKEVSCERSQHVSGHLKLEKKLVTMSSLLIARFVYFDRRVLAEQARIVFDDLETLGLVEEEHKVEDLLEREFPEGCVIAVLVMVGHCRVSVHGQDVRIGQEPKNNNKILMILKINKQKSSYLATMNWLRTSMSMTPVMGMTSPKTVSSPIRSQRGL